MDTTPKPVTLLAALRREKEARLRGGIYHRTQVDLAYNSNHIEGSSLTHEQTRLIFETSTIGVGSTPVRVDDIVETRNHFRAFDYIVDHAGESLDEAAIKRLHLILKSGTADACRDWFAVGDYKRLPNEVGGRETASPEQVAGFMAALIEEYNSKGEIGLDDILDFHQRFEAIHPFQDGNGRVGRLVMFKECLRAGVVPFVITDELKYFYYRGLSQWPAVKGYLRDTCLTAQDDYKRRLDYFRIIYNI